MYTPSSESGEDLVNRNVSLDKESFHQSEISEYIWNLKIPVQIMLHPLSIAHELSPLPLLTFFQRAHNPIFYYPAIHQFFERFAPHPLNEKDIWLEWNGVPIQWNIPFGVTYDLYNNTENKPQQDQIVPNNQNYETPTPDGNIDEETPKIQEIIVHYGGSNISSEILPISKQNDVLQTAKNQFKFNLKEALLIRNGQTFILTQINLSDQDKFWEGLLAKKSSDFFPVLDMFFSEADPTNQVKKIPFRIYLQGYQGRIQLGYQTSENSLETLGELLSKQFPKIISNTASSFIIHSEKYNELKVMSNGIELGLDTPLHFLLKCFTHYDGFIYLVIRY